MNRTVSCIALIVMLSVGLLTVLLVGERPIAANEECKKPGKMTMVGGTLVCDCTATANTDCQCILPPANCPPLND